MTHQGIKLDVLAFSAHPDYIELAAAGTIIKLKETRIRSWRRPYDARRIGTRGTMEAPVKKRQKKLES